MELRFSKDVARHKEKLNEIALLKADVRRLEKLCQNLGEDNMRLAHPPRILGEDGTLTEMKIDWGGKDRCFVGGKEQPTEKPDPWVEQVSLKIW